MPPPQQEQLKEGTQTPETAEQLGGLQQNVETTPLQTAVLNSLQRFVNLIKERDDFDFAGEHDSAEELEQNAAFQTIISGLKTFFEENAQKTPNAPMQYFSAWMNAAAEFMTNEIEDYDDSTGAMGIIEAEATIETLKDLNKTGPRTEISGIGQFEEWFKSNYAAEYDVWQFEKETSKQKTESLAVKRQELMKRVEDLEKRISNSQNVEEHVKKDLADLKQRIPNANDENSISGFETVLIALEGSVTAYEKQTAEKVKTDTEQAAKKQEQEAKETEEKAAEEQARLDAEEESAAPTVDKLLRFTAQLPEDSKLKPILKTIAALLVSIGVGIAKLPWIGNKLRGSFISNKLLAEQGDETAKLALKTERVFRKFGLSRALANELGGVATKEAVKALQKQAAEIKPEDISDEAEKKSAEAEKIKFTNLAEALTQRGGDKSEQSLFEFVANKEWEQPQTAQAPAPQPQAPSQTPQSPSPQPQSPPAAPTQAAAPAAAAAVKPPEKPTETPETKLIQATNEELKPFNNRTIDLTKETFLFRLPYITQNGSIDYANCSIRGNNFEIGGHKYKLELPMGANLQKITMEGPIQTGSTELVAGKFGLSDSKEIPLKTLLANLEALRKEPKNRTITIGNDNATFKYLA